MSDEQSIRSSVYYYNIVGAITLYRVSMSDREDVIQYSGPIDQIINITDDKVGFIDLVPGFTAFTVTVRQVNGRIEESFVAIVHEVYSYAIQDNRVELKFQYIKAPNVYTGVGITDIPPVMSHLFTAGDFIAIIFEGIPNEVFNLIQTKYRVMRHHGNIYYGQSMYLISSAEANIAADCGPLGIMLIGSKKEIPNRLGYSSFRDHMFQYAMRVYGYDITTEEVKLR